MLPESFLYIFDDRKFSGVPYSRDVLQVLAFARDDLRPKDRAYMKKYAQHVFVEIGSVHASKGLEFRLSQPIC